MNASRHIVITGVSRGLGRALADEFVQLGHIVTGCARSKEAIRDLAGRFSKPHRFDVVDVANDDEVARWATEVLTDRDPPDLLLNNAAVITPNAVLWETQAADFSQIVDVNIKGCITLSAISSPRWSSEHRG
jgi:NAD(P)-dependent dehydrogenase (short-subunit alcohol dehydrogenase family)